MRASGLLDLMDLGWPAASTQVVGPWVVREGRGGGRRVSSASVSGPGADTPEALAAAEMQHARFGQRTVFRLTPDDAADDAAADAALAARGYRVEEPSGLRTAPLPAEGPERLTAFPLWPPLAITVEIWEAGGIGAARRQVMDRAAGPKAAILGRVEDRAAGALYAVVTGDWLMVHALHVEPALRRKGLAQNLMRGAAAWGRDQGAGRIALAVTEANAGANALYDRMGFDRAGRYHYRVKG